MSAVPRRSPSAPSKFKACATRSAISAVRAACTVCVSLARVSSWRPTATCRFLLIDNTASPFHVAS